MKLTLVLFIFSIITRCSLGKPTEESSANQQLLQEIGKSVNFEVGPCKDFYTNACGNYEDNYEVDLETRMNREAEKEIGHYLNNTSMDDKPEFVKKAYAFYSSCLTTENKVNSRAYVQWIKDTDNLKWAFFPSDDDKETKYNWAHTLGVLRKYGMRDSLIQAMPYVTDNSSERIGLSFERPTFTFSLDLEELTLFFKGHLRDILSGNVWNEVDEFDTRLREILELHKDNHEEGVYALKDLKFTWLNQYVNAMLDTNVPLADMKIQIPNVPYIKALDGLLKKYDDKIICRYLEIIFFKHLQLIYDDESCVRSTMILLPEATHWIYEQMHPELEQAFQEVGNIFEKIKTQLKTSLHSKTNDIAADLFEVTHLETLKLKLGNIPRFETVKNLEAFYANLSLNNSDYYGNLLKVLNFHFKVGQVNVENEFGFIHRFEKYQVSRFILPYNDATSNAIIFPAEFLRPPYYHAEYSDIFKYSSLGRLLSFFAYTGLSVKGHKYRDIEKNAHLGSLQTVYQIFFSSLAANANETYSINGKNISLKNLFFLNAAHHTCEWIGEFGYVDERFSTLPEFKETFDCKS